MDRQIVDPDPGLNYNARRSRLAARTSKWEKKSIYIAAIQIVARLRIAMLDDAVLSL